MLANHAIGKVIQIHIIYKSESLPLCLSTIVIFVRNIGMEKDLLFVLDISKKKTLFSGFISIAGNKYFHTKKNRVSHQTV